MGFSPIANERIDKLANEIEISRSERYVAASGFGGTPVSGLAIGTNIQRYSFWSGQQGILEYMVTQYFVNHIAGPLNTGQTGLLSWTLATWRAAAGLNASGFRRVTEWDGVSTPTYSYGSAQVGDIIGPWLIDDLQKGYSMLRWSKRTGSIAEQEYFSTGSPSTYVFGYSWEEYMNNWNASSWRVAGDPSGFGAVATHGYDYYNFYVINGTRKRCKASISALPLTITGTMDVYFTMGPTSNPPYTNFVDIDSLGAVSGKLLLVDSSLVLDGVATTKQMGYYGNISTEPFSLIGGLPPHPPAYDDYSWRCESSGNPQLLMKWNFTYV